MNERRREISTHATDVARIKQPTAVKATQRVYVGVEHPVSDGLVEGETEHRQTHVRQTTGRAPIVISGAREDGVTEDQKQRRHSTRHRTAGRPPEFIDGWWHTRNLRRSIVTCGFLLRRLNDSGPLSDNYWHSSIDPISAVSLSGSANGSAQSYKSMSHHYRPRSHNHRPDESTTDRSEAPLAGPSDIFALIDEERILVTIAPYGWRTYIRREQPDEYAVRYENAAGVQSGKLYVNPREARQLVAEKCREAVWVDLQDRTAWPEGNHSEVSDG
jgi:hypothetical protein